MKNISSLLSKNWLSLNLVPVSQLAFLCIFVLYMGTRLGEDFEFGINSLQQTFHCDASENWKKNIYYTFFQTKLFYHEQGKFVDKSALEN